MRPAPSGGQDRSGRAAALAERLAAVACALANNAVADLIERLIAVLDARDPDPDLEPDLDEEMDADKEPEEEGCCDADEDHGTTPFDRPAWREKVRAGRRQAQLLLRSHAARRAA